MDGFAASAAAQIESLRWDSPPTLWKRGNPTKGHPLHGTSYPSPDGECDMPFKDSTRTVNLDAPVPGAGAASSSPAARVAAAAGGLTINSVEPAKTGAATCKGCVAKIAKGEPKFLVHEPGMQQHWAGKAYHISCVSTLAMPCAAASDIPGYCSLDPAQQSRLAAWARPAAAGGGGGGVANDDDDADDDGNGVVEAEGTMSVEEQIAARQRASGVVDVDALGNAAMLPPTKKAKLEPGLEEEKQ